MMGFLKRWALNSAYVGALFMAYAVLVCCATAFIFACVWLAAIAGKYLGIVGIVSFLMLLFTLAVGAWETIIEEDKP